MKTVKIIIWKTWNGEQFYYNNNSGSFVHSEREIITAQNIDNYKYHPNLLNAAKRLACKEGKTPNEGLRVSFVEIEIAE